MSATSAKRREKDICTEKKEKMLALQKGREKDVGKKENTMVSQCMIVFLPFSSAEGTF